MNEKATPTVTADLLDLFPHGLYLCIQLIHKVEESKVLVLHCSEGEKKKMMNNNNNNNNNRINKVMS